MVQNYGTTEEGTQIKDTFKTLAVQYNPGGIRVSAFSVNDDPGKWICPIDNTIDTIDHHAFEVYGVLEDMDDLVDEDYTPPEDYSSIGVHIGTISGWLVLVGLIVNLGGDPYEACDAVSGELEAMYSVVEEYGLDDALHIVDVIYYIHEIELKTEYQNKGYESILLQQLPAILVTSLRVFPDLLMYYPRPTQHEEPKLDEEAEAVLMHRISYSIDGYLKNEDSNNVAFFPPIKKLSRERVEKALNQYLGKRNPGATVPIDYRNKMLYKLYESAGFKEAGQSGWLYKRIANIFTRDGV